MPSITRLRKRVSGSVLSGPHALPRSCLGIAFTPASRLALLLLVPSGHATDASRDARSCKGAVAPRQLPAATALLRVVRSGCLALVYADARIRDDCGRGSARRAPPGFHQYRPDQ